MSKILVVDDNSTNIFVLSTMLQQMGFQVEEASSGIEAVNAVCHESYSLVLVDHLMPEMDGVKTIKQIRFVMRGEECPEFIGVSSNVDKEVIEDFASVEVDNLLERPVKREELEQMLHKIGISVDAADVEDESAEINYLDILKEVDGLDYEKGIDLMAGSAENYMKVLPVCVKNVQDNFLALDLIRETSQFESFALHFHSLKGIFLNIAADGIAEEARTLELAAKENNMDLIQENIDGFMEKVEKIHKQLASVSEKYTELKMQSLSGEQISDSEFAQNLEELKQHIEDFEYMEIMELLEKMLAGADASNRPALEKVNRCIQEFDYDGALAEVERMR